MHEIKRQEIEFIPVEPRKLQVSCAIGIKQIFV